MKVKKTHLVLSLILLLLVGIFGFGIYDLVEERLLTRGETLNIVIYPNEILRETALRVEEISPEVEEFSEQIINTLERAGGVGLSAPQVGVSERIIVVKLDRGLFSNEFLIMINPEIIEESGNNVSAMEGCSSIPGKRIEVSRPEWIIVKYQNLAKKEVIIEERGWNARIIQHEIDHLNGILIIDYSLQ